MPRIKAKERFGIAALDAKGFADYISTLTLPDIGANSRLLLSELGIRLDLPADAVAIIVNRKNKEANHLYIWSTYNPEKVEAIRSEPGRKWNDTVKANTFVLNDSEVDRVLEFSRRHYTKILVLDGGGHRIETGLGIAAWTEKPLYDLLKHPVTVNLSSVVEGLQHLRPHDQAQRISIHGDVDPVYRSLFGMGMKVDERIHGIEISTRHPLILFRLPVLSGQVRYLKYSAEEGKGLEVFFGDAANTRQVLSVFKETQQRLSHPVIEHDPELLQRLRLIERWPDSSPHP